MSENINDNHSVRKWQLVIDQVNVTKAEYPCIDLMKVLFGVQLWIEEVPVTTDSRVCPGIDLVKILFGTHPATCLGTTEIEMCPGIDLVKTLFGTHPATDLGTTEIEMCPGIDLM
jgi:hypothetical protein